MCKHGLPVPCRRGVLIEAGPNNFARLVQNRPNALCINLPICNSRRHVSLVEQWGEGDLPLCHAHVDCHRATLVAFTSVAHRVPSSRLSATWAMPEAFALSIRNQAGLRSLCRLHPLQWLTANERVLIECVPEAPA